MNNIYAPIKTKVDKIIEESPTIKTFVLRPYHPISFKTGQFVEIAIPGVGEAPFTPSSDPNIDKEMEVTIMNAGKVTSKLHEIGENVDVGLRGPYGNGYPLDKFKEKSVLIVGGGVGLAPLRSLIYALLAELDKYKKVTLCYGAKTPEDIIFKKQVQQWSKDIKVDLSVDKATAGWEGKVGVVTVLLDGLKIDLTNTVSVVCGPPIMMKFSTFKLLDLGFKPENIYLSMEKNMSCGLGKCGHCRLGKYYACKDGPVFSFDMIKDIHDIWD